MDYVTSDYSIGAASPRQLPPCPLCEGERVLPIPMERWPKGVISPVEPCSCVKAAELVQDLDRAAPGLSGVDPVRASPLADLVGKSAVIRVSMIGAARHLARVLRDNPATRAVARTVTDSDLVDAQFSMHRRDAEVLADRILLPGLLVLQLGCVHGRHKMLPQVIGQAVVRRAQRSAPTWIVDARTLGPGHPAWSQQLARIVGIDDGPAAIGVERPPLGKLWPVVDLDPPDPAEAAQQDPVPAPTAAASAVVPPSQDPLSGVDPVIAALVRRKGWSCRPQGNGGVRVCCPKHQDPDYECSIFLANRGHYAGKPRYKCQVASCGAAGDPEQLAAAS